MKKTNLFSAITFLFIMVACVGPKDQLDYDLISVNVNAKYPKKELILQDFMDVEAWHAFITDSAGRDEYRGRHSGDWKLCAGGKV